MKNRTIRTAVCICLIAVLLCGGIVYGGVRYLSGRISQANQTSAGTTDTVAPQADNRISQMSNLQLNSRDGNLLDPTEIYELAIQQVVGISTQVTSPNVFGQMVTGSVSGTGFIISSDGYILTNNHVVETAYKQDLKVTVMLYDGTEYEAKIVGVEGDNNDIAVLKFVFGRERGAVDLGAVGGAGVGDDDLVAVAGDLAVKRADGGVLQADGAVVGTADGDLVLGQFEHFSAKLFGEHDEFRDSGHFLINSSFADPGRCFLRVGTPCPMDLRLLEYCYLII